MGGKVRKIKICVLYKFVLPCRIDSCTTLHQKVTFKLVELNGVYTHKNKAKKMAFNNSIKPLTNINRNLQFVWLDANGAAYCEISEHKAVYLRSFMNMHYRINDKNDLMLIFHNVLLAHGFSGAFVRLLPYLRGKESNSVSFLLV